MLQRFAPPFLLLVAFFIGPIDGQHLQQLTEFVRSRPTTISENLHALLQAASFVAEHSLEESKRENIFAHQGNVFDVPDEILFYGQCARFPDVLRIGEIGFNAGHSTITFLWQNPRSTLTSFDLGEMKWTPTSVDFVSRIFPKRFTYIKGYSTDTVPKYDGPVFDLFAIDGGHNGAVPFQDMQNGRRVTKRGGYVVIDDWTDTNRDVKSAWARAKSEGWITEILCVDPKVVVFGAQKAYCVGLYS
jgi:hypothetical protein